MSLPLKEVVKIAERQLVDNGVQDAAIDAKLLMQFYLRTDRTGLLMRWQDIMQDKRVEGYLELVERRASHVPLQYIIGTQEFMGLTFKVNESVLIPRQDTETMVEDALELIKTGKLRGEDYVLEEKSGMSVLDLCTGSGAIAVAIAKLAEKVSVTASDISGDALSVATENAKANGASVKFVQGDLFEPFAGKLLKKKFDLIITNPPYIPTTVIDTLEPEVKVYEPKLALDGGPDGLDIYRRIVLEAGAFLKKGGVFMTEIGYDQGEALKNLLEESGDFEDVRVLKDLAEKDRIVVAKLIDKKKK